MSLSAVLGLTQQHEPVEVGVGVVTPDVLDVGDVLNGPGDQGV